MPIPLLRRPARAAATLGARLSWAALLPLTPRQRSSITDNGWWSNFCLRTARSERRFARFRRKVCHRVIVEAAPAAEGRLHMARLLRQTPHYEAVFPRFRSLDQIGTPHTAEFPPHGWWAPNTVRYMRYLSDCETLFGSLDGATVVEIGIGFGGQCKIFFDRFRIGRYVLIDLPGPLALARRVLEEAHGADLVRERMLFLEAGPSGTPAGLPAGEFDLAISTLAFSECSRTIQEGYLRSVFGRSRCGYIHHNAISNWFGVESMSLADLRNALPQPLAVEKDDATYWYDRTDMLTWGGPACGPLTPAP